MCHDRYMPIPAMQDHRLYVPWPAVVTNNEDPQGRHRVKTEVFGIVKETAWAEPLTSGGGSSARGGHMVPAIGSDVVVWFLGGDIDRPVYMASYWGVTDSGPEAPLTIANAGSSAHLVSEWQIGPLLFTVDERPRNDSDGSGQRFVITDTAVDKEILEYDFQNQGWRIESDFLIQIVTSGILRLEGTTVQINDRVVKLATVRQI